MKPLTLAWLMALALVTGAVAMQEIPAPPPGNPGHPPLPNTVFCTSHGSQNNAAHHCDCKRTCEERPDKTLQNVEDPMCRVYCAPNHCHCGGGCP